ncbi:hypothetical protein A9W98_19010 [Mycobacterium gordonae]|uniref:Uncharacterized protein n=1 Tax=Mycobacterium gordonae TaxID=1778 RepID=A0A1A6BH55_MYCGO|nr:hypothetical protein A9W98_19010 [Mycobacterium gordonae]
MFRHALKAVDNLLECASACAFSSDCERLAWRSSRKDRRIRKIARVVFAHVAVNGVEPGRSSCRARILVQLYPRHGDAQPGSAHIKSARAREKIDYAVLAD